MSVQYSGPVYLPWTNAVSYSTAPVTTNVYTTTTPNVLRDVVHIGRKRSLGGAASGPAQQPSPSKPQSWESSTGRDAAKRVQSVPTSFPAGDFSSGAGFGGGYGFGMESSSFATSPWRSTQLADGRVYYYNPATQETTWDRPSDFIEPHPQQAPQAHPAPEATDELRTKMTLGRSSNLRVGSLPTDRTTRPDGFRVPPPAANRAVPRPSGGPEEAFRPAHVIRSTDQTPFSATDEDGLPQWKTATSPDGRIYYFNIHTRETCWELPPGVPVIPEGGRPVAETPRETSPTTPPAGFGFDEQNGGTMERPQQARENPTDPWSNPAPVHTAPSNPAYRSLPSVGGLQPGALPNLPGAFPAAVSTSQAYSPQYSINTGYALPSYSPWASSNQLVLSTAPFISGYTPGYASAGYSAASGAVFSGGFARSSRQHYW